MCMICRTMPCAHGCPNSSWEPDIVANCEFCGRGIFSGDEYVKLKTNDEPHIFCEECFSCYTPEVTKDFCTYLTGNDMPKQTCCDVCGEEILPFDRATVFDNGIKKIHYHSSCFETDAYYNLYENDVYEEVNE